MHGKMHRCRRIIRIIHDCAPHECFCPPDTITDDVVVPHSTADSIMLRGTVP
jgi:hypothetical protein